MSRRKVEACWKIDIKDMRASLNALIPQQPAGRVWREWGDFKVECLEPGEVWVRVWMYYPSFTARLRVRSTAPFLGGRRWWFACPCCRRQCRVVYLPTAGTELRCRRCWHLRYQSQSRSDLEQYWRTITKFRRRLRMRDVYAPCPPLSAPLRPRGMHYKNYAKLVHKLEVKESIYACLVQLQAQRRQRRRSW